jgi:flagellin-specific chaperone FliS
MKKLIKENELKELETTIQQLKEEDEDRQNEILEEKEAILSELKSNLSKTTHII